MHNSGITAQTAADSMRCPLRVQARKEAYQNQGKLNIIMLLLPGFSPGTMPLWQSHTSPLGIF